MIIRGQFHSLWEEGEVVTNATLDTVTGEVTTEAVAGDGFEHLMEETFEASDTGDNYDICPDCHNHILDKNGKCTDSSCGYES